MDGSRSGLAVYLEAGSKKVFAGAVEWPGWCRGGRDEATALAALLAYGPRYQAAVGSSAGLGAPLDSSAFVIVERLPGGTGTGTDFGVPSLAPAADGRPIGELELERLSRLLEAGWATFDAATKAAAGVELRRGPRGGGRQVEAIVAHVFEAEINYLAALGGAHRRPAGAEVAAEMALVRQQVLEILRARVDGGPLPETRRTSPLWLPRYFVRRSAWHAFDHAWEIEDRSGRAG